MYEVFINATSNFVYFTTKCIILFILQKLILNFKFFIGLLVMFKSEIVVNIINVPKS